MTTAIKTCTCKSEFQDKLYGPGKRVMNEGNNKVFICTVCDKKFTPDIGKKK